MSNVSKCFSCVHKNDYDPKFGYYGCNLSGQECKGYSMFEPKVKPKPITNADSIRAMSDEELAEYMSDIAGWLSEYEGKAHALLKWLKAPVKAEEGKADDS